MLVPGTRKAVGKDGFTSPGLSGYRLNGVILSHAIAIDSRSTDRFGISFCWELSPVGYRIVISRVYQVAVVVGSIEFCGLPSLGELGGHVGSGELVAVDGPAAAGGLGWGGLCWCGVGCGVVSGGDEVGDGDCEGYEEDAHGGEDDGGLGVTLGWWLLWGGLVLGVCRAGLAGVVGLVWGVGWAAGLGVARGSGWCLAVVGGLGWVVRRLGHQGSSGSRGRGSYCIPFHDVLYRWLVIPDGGVGRRSSRFFGWLGWCDLFPLPSAHDSLYVSAHLIFVCIPGGGSEYCCGVISFIQTVERQGSSSLSSGGGKAVGENWLPSPCLSRDLIDWVVLRHAMLSDP